MEGEQSGTKLTRSRVTRERNPHRLRRLLNGAGAMLGWPIGKTKRRHIGEAYLDDQVNPPADHSLTRCCRVDASLLMLLRCAGRFPERLHQVRAGLEARVGVL